MTKPIKELGVKIMRRRSAIESAWIKTRKGPNASVGKVYAPINSTFIVNGNFSINLMEFVSLMQNLLNRTALFSAHQFTNYNT